ncbi:MAG: amidase [Armatimonadota bacterium]|nr:amidase [Armatimonadota bacterium]
MAEAMTPITDLSARAMARAIRRRELSPVAVLEAHLARIDQLEGSVGAWVHIDRSGALEAARAMEAEARTGRFRGPLHGVPVGVKDIFDVAGMVTTSGAPAFAHRLPAADAAAVARLRGAGAIIIGKTTTTAFAYADPTGTRNPWNLEHTPGGSSSGSAAAVASHMVPLALGSQTIGSTLRPAAYCGIVGLKATYGVISAMGVTPLAWSLDHVGILARDVEDAALALAVLADPARAATGGDRRPPRLGIPRALFVGVATPEVTAHVEAVAERLARAGATVDDVAVPRGAAALHAAGQLVLRVEAAAYHAGQFAAHRDTYPPRIRGLVESGLGERAVDYVAAQRTRAQFRDEMAPILRQFDALLMPVAPSPAPRGLETTGDPVLCAPWSFGGQPAIALPSGLTGAGLPLAIQLAAGADAEARLLDVARWCEGLLEFTAAPSLVRGPAVA